MKQLTDKQRAFVVNKAGGVPHRDAAIAAGYAVGSAEVAAHKLMQNPAIVAAIKAAKGSASVDTPAGLPTMPQENYTDAKEFLLDAMNLQQLPLAARADYAKALLPYQHARIGESGKKEKAKDRAAELVKGRAKFAPKGAPQLRVVTNSD